MSDWNRATHRYTLIQPIVGQTLIVGKNLKVPCRLNYVSTMGARMELLPSSFEQDEVSELIHEPDTEIISVFQQVCLGPWKMSLLIRHVTPTGDGYSIWGSYANTPIVPVQGLIDLLNRHEAFHCYAEDNRFVVEGDFTAEAFRQAIVAINHGMAVLDLTQALIYPDTEQMIAAARTAGVSILSSCLGLRSE